MKKGKDNGGLAAINELFDTFSIVRFLVSTQFRCKRVHESWIADYPPYRLQDERAR